MPSQPSGPIRRSQLIAPFGPGSIVTVPGGTSVTIGGLDFWFQDTTHERDLDPQEFQIGEWRLEKLLHVDHFRLPPDFRRPSFRQKTPNVAITIPTLRFPKWHFCAFCRLLIEVGTFTRGRVKCSDCAKQGRIRYMNQVPFVAMCSNGHLRDFPWREWVHKSVDPTCNGKLRLKSTGSATLAGQVVECEGCEAKRSLEGIISGAQGNTITDRLAKDISYLCNGHRPWLGPDTSEPCGALLQGSLRSASNLYFANVISSLYLPRSEETSIQDIIRKLEEPVVNSLVQLLNSLAKGDLSIVLQGLRGPYSEQFKTYSDSEMETAVEIVVSSGDQIDLESGHILEAPDSSFRRSEFDVLRNEKEDELLQIRVADLSQYNPDVAQYFSRITLVQKLRETRVLAGFTRVFPNSAQELYLQQCILWLNQPPPKDRWLPAYTVFGEGIFLEFNETLLQAWETKESIQSRTAPLDHRFRMLQQDRHLRERDVNPRFVLIHTFAHLLMNQLTFECGYSSASLRERLYVSTDLENPMAGLLIYTADGDSEGTLGGLVRMGKAGHLEPVIRRALEQAKWCSADPVCMEVGREHGQGPDSCNLAACHNCALVPETACEEFNRFLDRGSVVGDFHHPDIAFFNL